ncbi:hypothetical protein J2800_001045 [Caulobacter rhizosphaerae]|uniref:Uncharacterized protein n=1 Tax=Caulobacter rhizosphaerae TaxID=2010972 RepID=A0ABU1MVV3_9CAUL|nr:hypothetical protein [Caulobacter rhizosphaerae]MDR6530309.1 hypothetical protein [Caulobacter rhizosphaerae]
MNRLKADCAKRRFQKLVALAEDEPLARLIWAVRNLQTHGGDAHRQVFIAPPEAFTTDINTGAYVMPWTLETLLNELLTTPKQKRFRGECAFGLDCSVWSTITELHDRLMRWEHSEEAIEMKAASDDIGRLMHALERYGHQQFPWQRGDLNPTSFYRSARLYGGSEATAYLESRGLSLNALSATGIAIAVGAARHPYVEAALDLRQLGISPQAQRAAVDRICLPWSQARSKTSALRAGRRHPAFAPSLLRLFPAFSGFNGGHHLLVPLPELVFGRVTSGIYYDVIDGGPAVRNEIGKAFEHYTAELLQGTVAGLRCEGEHRYRVRKNRIDSPDVIATTQSGELALLVECKAKKMPYEAKFGDATPAKGDTGFEEVAKGAYQIWRYVAHCRLGLTGRTLPQEVVGVVATLDAWLQISPWGKDGLLDRAREMASEKCPDIEAGDMIDVAFYPIEMLEQVLLTLPDHKALRQIRSAAKFRADQPLAPVDEEAEPEEKIPKPYPFMHDFGRVLPWWRTMRAGGS